jgi:energy-coupling factor transporter ATP-binding protein EcfA2
VNDASYEQLVDRLERDHVAPATVDVILAAAEGPEVLDAHLDGVVAPSRRSIAASPAHAAPARVYLEHVIVENFRGIGAAAKLQLAPGPGLTLVVGRNGSGKSSFAEGLELLLTDTNVRWSGMTKVWSEGWRNLHGTGPTRLAARFRVDGAAEPLDVTRTWAPGCALDDGDQIAVSGPRSSWSELGWDEALQQFRPLLSYSELGAMFSTRAAALYEALSAVLGVHEFDDLAAVLRTARLAREKSGKAEKVERSELRGLTQSADDPRALALDELLATRDADRDAVERLLVGGSAGASAEAELKSLVALRPPEQADIRRTLEAEEEASTDVEALAATDAERLDDLAMLLDRAMRFHERHGDDQRCPVCGATERLDESWSLRTQAEVQELQRNSAALRTARQCAHAAREAVRALFEPSTPATLRRAASAGIDVRAALDAWEAWAAASALDLALASTLRAALERAVELAREEELRRDVDWQPVRAAAVHWLATARDAARDKALVPALKTAEAWMSQCVAVLRRERLAPVVDAARENWGQLRHESNVALGDVQLRKQGMQRYAAFDVTVDGAGASAFGVMSQGELSALAVSVFLPRAALPESPFGFMVIDDPVQSMDPAKVDGLARVLSRAAADRQVVVFTHDERLPEAVRRLAIDARVIAVKRRAQSKVELVAGRPPSDRYIGEALALAKTDGLTAEVGMRVIPGFCRGALEAACAARLRKLRIEAGVAHADVEEELEGMTSLGKWLATAFELKDSQGREVDDRLRAIDGEDAVRSVRTIKRGSHELASFDPMTLIETTKRIVRAIEP